MDGLARSGLLEDVTDWLEYPFFLDVKDGWPASRPTFYLNLFHIFERMCGWASLATTPDTIADAFDADPSPAV